METAHESIGAPDSAFIPHDCGELMSWINEALLPTQSDEAELLLGAMIYAHLLDSGFSRQAVMLGYRTRTLYEILLSEGDAEAAVKACGELRAFIDIDEFLSRRTAPQPPVLLKAECSGNHASLPFIT
jgi:hypothetical protein